MPNRNRNRDRNRGRRRRPLGKGLLGDTPGALRPTPRRKIARQSRRLMRDIFSPVFTELDEQEQTAQSIFAKRQSDNEYYLDWLNTQSEQLRAHAETADTRLSQAQTDIQQQSAQAMQQLQQNLVTEAGANVGNVSDPNQAAAFNVAPEAQRNQDLIAAERQRTAQQMQSASQTQGTAAAANFGLMAAANTRNQSDLQVALKEIMGEKVKARQERAGATAQEIARRLDQEIAKAQSKVDMKNLAAQLALGLKAHRLTKAQLAEEIRASRAAQRGEAADRRLDRRGQREEERHNLETEEDADRDRRDDRRDDREEGGGGRRDNRQELARDRKDALAAARDLGRRALQKHDIAWLRKHMSDFVNEIQDRTGVPYSVAREMARKWIKRQSNESGTGEIPNATTG